VSLSNDPARVGQPVLIVAIVQGDVTRLVLDVGGESFRGLGFIAGIAGGEVLPNLSPGIHAGRSSHYEGKMASESMVRLHILLLALSLKMGVLRDADRSKRWPMWNAS